MDYEIIAYLIIIFFAGAMAAVDLAHPPGPRAVAGSARHH